MQKDISLYIHAYSSNSLVFHLINFVQLKSRTGSVFYILYMLHIILKQIHCKIKTKSTFLQNNQLKLFDTCFQQLISLQSSTSNKTAIHFRRFTICLLWVHGQQVLQATTRRMWQIPQQACDVVNCKIKYNIINYKQKSSSTFRRFV